MISVKGASFGRFGGWRRRHPGGSECRSIFLTVSRAMPNRLAASRWLRPSTWQASRTRRYRSTVYILPPSISKKIEGYRWQSFTPPAAGKSRRFRGLICHRRSHGLTTAGASGQQAKINFAVTGRRNFWTGFPSLETLTVLRKRLFVVGMLAMEQRRTTRGDQVIQPRRRKSPPYIAPLSIVARGGRCMAWSSMRRYGWRSSMRG